MKKINYDFINKIINLFPSLTVGISSAVDEETKWPALNTQYRIAFAAGEEKILRIQ